MGDDGEMAKRLLVEHGVRSGWELECLRLEGVMMKAGISYLAGFR